MAGVQARISSRDIETELVNVGIDMGEEEPGCIAGRRVTRAVERGDPAIRGVLTDGRPWC